MADVSAVEVAAVPDERAHHQHPLERLAEPSTNFLVSRSPKYVPTLSSFIVGILLGPLRVLLIMFSLLTMAFFSWLIQINRASRDRPLGPVRRLLVTVFVRPWFRVMLFAFGFLWIEESGSPVGKRDAAFVIVNHVGGAWEAMYASWRTGASTVVEASNFAHPLLRVIFDACEGLAISRENPAGVREVIKRRARDPAWPQLLIFPEGACSNGTALLTFKTGAFAPLEPVQPGVVSYPTASTFDLSWVTLGPSVDVLAQRMICRLFNRMRFQWLPPRSPAETEKLDGGFAFSRAVREQMATALGAKLVNVGVDDILMGAVARRAKHNPLHAIVELQTIRSFTRVDLAEAKAVVAEFIAVADENGRLSFPPFVRLMEGLMLRGRVGEVGSGAGGAGGGGTGGGAAAMASADIIVDESKRTRTDSEVETSLDGARRISSSGGGGDLSPAQRSILDLHALFSLFDVGGDGTLDCREFIVGLALLNDRPPPAAQGGILDEAAAAASHAEFLHMCFALLADGSARVPVDRFARVLHHVWPEMPRERIDEIFHVASGGVGGGGFISEASFVAWVANPDVATHLPLFRKRFFGHEDLLADLVPAKPKEGIKKR